jgi:hypothetical protein
MPIRQFLRSQSFDPEAIEVMSKAYQDACRTLGLADRGDPMNELIAKQIIQLAQSGVRTPTALYMITVTKFKSNPQ